MGLNGATIFGCPSKRTGKWYLNQAPCNCRDCRAKDLGYLAPAGPWEGEDGRFFRSFHSAALYGRGVRAFWRAGVQEDSAARREQADMPNCSCPECLVARAKGFERVGAA